MTAKLEDYPDWTIELDEVSAGVYRLRGRNHIGWTIDLTGTDPDHLLDEARRAAAEMA